MEDIMHIRDPHGHMTVKTALILEDDVYFVPDALNQLNEFMCSIPNDWGQLYLGGQHQKPATPCAGYTIGNSVNRTHAYAVSSRYIQSVYRHISYMPDYVGTNRHVDHQLETAHARKDWPVYCPPIWFAGQEAGSSNISGNTNSRQIWI